MYKRQAQQFRLSRGPIHQALRELAREGLVVEVPRRGTFVSTITQADLIEVYSVRAALEVRAIRDAVKRATPSEIKALNQAYRVMDEAWSKVQDAASDNVIWTSAITADNAFHRAIIGLAKNGRMASIYEQMTSQTTLLLVTAAETDMSLRVAPFGEVHRDIADAISRRDVEAACAAVEEHYEYTRSRLFAASEAATSRRGHKVNRASSR